MDHWHSTDIAIEDSRGPVTYAELRAGAERAARRLAARGVVAGDRVATTLPAARDFAELLHAMPLLGTVLVPLNTRLTGAERDAQVELARPALVVDAPLEGPQAEVELLAEPDPEAPVTLLYTSGSTGAPKPVEHTWANHVASAAASAGRIPLGPGDRWLCVLPLFHVGGLAVLIRCALAGATAVVHEGFEPDAASAALRDVTVASLVPTMLRRMEVPHAPRLRAVLLGGGPIPRDLLDSPLPLMPTYGMTETASQVVTAEPGESAGRPLSGVEVRIAGDGEILVRGPMVARGALAGDGWLHTGDRGRLDAGGRLHVEGRLKDVIVTGGENVSAVEVEEVLLSHPAVEDAAVIGRPDPDWGEAVVAFVAGAADPAEVGRFCRERLAPFKVPKSITPLAAIPRTAAGKADRALLARMMAPVDLGLAVIARYNEAAGGGDVEPFLDAVHPSLEWRTLTVAAEGRWLRGHAEVERYFGELRDSFSSASVAAVEARDLGEGIVLMAGPWRATGRASGIEVVSQWASANEFRDGLLVWSRVYESRDEALAAAERRRRGKPDPG